MAVALEREYNPGQSILLTRDGCDLCDKVKQKQEIREGLESGNLIEISNQHPDYAEIVQAAGVTGVPTIVSVTATGGFEKVK